MKKLLLILFVLALPSFSFAQEVIGTDVADPSPKSQESQKSWLANDIFHLLAHACNIGSSTCGPDNLVTNPFGARIQFFVPTTQNYVRFYIITDIEGNVVAFEVFSSVLTAGTIANIFLSTGTFTLPTSSSVATRGLYKFISIINGANGQLAFSDYYRFRVLP